MAGGTRQRILDAALESFLERGYEQTTIAHIRERSGTSNGALFHHFASKDAIADALFVEAISSFHQGLWEMLRRKPRSLRAAVAGTIAHQLSWVELNRDLARYIYMRGHLDWDSSAAAEVSELNDSIAGAFREWMTPLAERGELRVTSMLLISAIVNGPAHAIARRWLAGHLDSPPTAFVDELAGAAWAALRGKPMPVKETEPAKAPRARLTLELLDPAGETQARGQVEAALTAPSDPRLAPR